MKYCVLLCALALVGSAVAQTCSTTSWCQTVGVPTHNDWPPNNGWNKLVFAHDTGKFYIFANAPVSPVTFENGFHSYTTLGSVAASNPYTLISTCGDNQSTSIVAKKLTLANTIGSGDSSLTFNVSGGSLPSTMPASGPIWVEDEAMNYASCTSAGGGGNCGAGSSSLTLSGLTRGQRTSVGWLAASGHNSGVQGNLSCPAPVLNGSASTDHPPTRHPVGTFTYDSKRGRLIQGWGYQENWQFQDLWYLCIFAPGSGPSNKCTSSDIAAGWQRIPLFAAGSNPSGYTENAMTYDPDDDVLVSFGGLNGGTSTTDTFVFCLATNSVWVDSTHTCASSGYLNTWRKVTFHGGNPGNRDAARLAWDSVNHLILVFGGASSTVHFHSVAIYHPLTGDWCMSETVQAGQTNASSCSLPAISGTEPNPSSAKFPPWAFVPSLIPPQAAYYAGSGDIYTYDAAANSWTFQNISGGPALPTQRSGVSWDNDDINHQLVMVMANTGGGAQSTWQLPTSILGPSISPPGSPTGLAATAGNAQVGLSWIAPSTGGAPTGYHVKRATTSGAETTIATVVGISYTDTGRTNATQYFYKVSAVNAGGESADSSEVNATPVSGAEGTPSPLSLSFGNENLTIPSASKAVVLTSSGGSSLTSVVISITGDFSQTNNCPGTLTSTSTCTINVTFTPTVAGIRAGTLSIADNAADSPQTVGLTGVGIVPKPTVIQGSVIKR